MSVFDEHAEAFRRIRAWLELEDVDRAAMYLRVRASDADPADRNRYWPDAGDTPDYEALAEAHLADEQRFDCYAEAIPHVRHQYGTRGTPMTLAMYLGGRVTFEPRTVWVDPVVDSWAGFTPVFDERNPWWQRSRALMETYTKKAAAAGAVASLPDFGDALTCFSLLRGAEQLVLDLLADPGVMQRRVREFVEVWKLCHRQMLDIYREHFEGDACWLTWAPGSVYACQCDFSALLSPDLFRQFVVPELDMMGQHLDYQVFHWDGPDEIKFLDQLLGVPTIRALQWVPGAGQPTAVHRLDMLKRVQAADKGLYVYATNREEAELLLRELSPRGLFIHMNFPLEDEGAVQALLEFARRHAGSS